VASSWFFSLRNYKDDARSHKHKISFDFVKGIFGLRVIVWIFRLHKGEEVFDHINESQPLKIGRYCMNLAKPQLFIYLFIWKNPAIDSFIPYVTNISSSVVLICRVYLYVSVHLPQCNISEFIGGNCFCSSLVRNDSVIGY